MIVPRAHVFNSQNFDHHQKRCVFSTPRRHLVAHHRLARIYRPCRGSWSTVRFLSSFAKQLNRLDICGVFSLWKAAVIMIPRNS